MLCKDVTREQAEKLLEAARDNAKPVTARAARSRRPAKRSPITPTPVARGVARFGSAEPQAEIPFVVEAWAEARSTAKRRSTVCVNRTPITGEIEAARDKRDIDAFGCGLAHTIAQAPKDEHFDIWLNITTPYMPITSDGKAPDLEPFLGAICDRRRQGREARLTVPMPRARSQKDMVLDNLDAVIADVSGDGEYRFNERQLFYALRPIVMRRDRTRN